VTDNVLYAKGPVRPASAVEAAVKRALATGRAIDLVEPESDTIRAELAAAIRWEDADGAPRRAGEFRLGPLAGRAYRLGDPSSFKSRHVQLHCETPDGVAVLTWQDRFPAPGPAPLRVAPLRTVLLAGVDDAACALVGPLRGLGFHVEAAEAAGVTSRERILDLADRGVRVLEADDADGAVVALRAAGGVGVVLEGWCGDTILSPEGVPERPARDAEGVNRRLTEAVAGAFGAPVLRRDAAATPDGEPLTPIEAACLALLMPLGGPGVSKGSAEAVIDLLLPTARPYDEPNRHATDGPVVRVAGDVERRLTEHLTRHAPTVLARLAPSRARRGQAARSHALAVHQRIGPWTAHVLIEATLSTILRADRYRRALERHGAWVADPREVLLDDPAIQNLLANRLGLIHWYWPMATVTRLSDRAIRVVCLAPTLAAGVPARLRWAVKAAGLAAGPLAERLVSESLDEPMARARFHATFGGRDGVAPRVRAEGVTSVAVGPVTGADPSVTEEDGGLILRSAPRGRRGPAHWVALLELLHRKVSASGRLVQVFDEEAEELARYLLGRHLKYAPDPDIPGRARAPFACGALAGVRVLLGSERVPDARRSVQVIAWRRDERAGERAPVVFVPGRQPGEPLVAAPLRALLVLGFGNIAGDAGILAQRLGLWVTAFNRSPNERARYALEHGIACYEFDETLDAPGRRLARDEQRQAYARAGLPLAGTVRDLLREGAFVAQVERGVIVRAPVRVIVDGLFGTARHPGTGQTVKVSELYKELLLDEAEAAGIPTIYEGANNPQVVARGRVVSQDFILARGVPVESVLPRDGEAFRSVQCVSCNTTNLWTLSLALSALPKDEAPELEVSVLLLRKMNDQYVGEHRQATGTQGMLLFSQPKYVRDLWQFVQGLDEPAVRARETGEFRRLFDHFSAFVGHQPGTDLHFGLVHLSRRDGRPLSAEVVRRALSSPKAQHLQLLDPEDRFSSMEFLRKLYYRMGFRNLYVHPAAVWQAGTGVLVIFLTPHLHNVKLNTLTFASVLAGLAPATSDGVSVASGLVDRLLRVADQRRQIGRYYPIRPPEAAKPPEPERATAVAPAPRVELKAVYLFGGGQAEAAALDPVARRHLLGGKGAGLAEMGSLTVGDPSKSARRPIPVPPGYTITTAQAQRYFANGNRLPEDLLAEISDAQSRLEALAGRRLGDPADPLLVSVRSGARVSMPGMMDTVLNLGLTDRSVEGLARASGNPRFAWDSYARFVEMFGDVVCGVSRAEHFRPIRERAVAEAGRDESGFTVEQLKRLVRDFQAAVETVTGRPFPQDPELQLRMAIEAVFRSSYNERAILYRKIHELPEDTVSAASVVAMVFGNKGPTSATGVAFTRDPLTGERVLNGEYLTEAQGEDVVAGIRTGRKLGEMAGDPGLAEAARDLAAVAEALERHYKDAQDIEFTIEEGRLWILQTRALEARSGRASLRIVTDMVDEGILTPSEAVMKFGDPERLIEVMQPIFDPEAERAAGAEGRLVTGGIAASVGAATGEVAFSSREAAEAGRAGRKVILVRPETSPDDIEGMEAAQGILTSRGGRTSHAAVVARGMGKAAVVGADAILIDEEAEVMKVGAHEIRRGEVISIDGSTGMVYRGALPLITSPVKRVLEGQPVGAEDEEIYRRFARLLEWARHEKALEILANADTPNDVALAIRLGAEGVGLLRTEHAVLAKEEQRVALAALLMALVTNDRREIERALEVLFPFMRENVRDIFRAFNRVNPGAPAKVTVRFFDPVVNEFLPGSDADREKVAVVLGVSPAEVRHRAERMREINPMLGNRGVRLVVASPELAAMQARAAFEAAADVVAEGGAPIPELEIPLVIGTEEVQRVSSLVRQVARRVMRDRGVHFEFRVGVMVETPAGVRTANTYAPHIQFISFGMNDLTQTVLAISRDDAGKFMRLYTEEGIFTGDPFKTIDANVVGSFVKEATTRARSTNPDIWVGAAGDLGGDPLSVEFFHEAALDGVSASPWLIPISILAAAQANLKRPRTRRPAAFEPR
jgi:pyruvate,orthophosphate dikinase